VAHATSSKSTSSFFTYDLHTSARVKSCGPAEPLGLTPGPPGRYRNPLFTAFAHKYEEVREKNLRLPKESVDEEASQAVPTVGRPGMPSSTTSTRRRFLLAHTLHCNPRLAEYISDNVGRSDGLERAPSFQVDRSEAESGEETAPGVSRGGGGGGSAPDSHAPPVVYC
jgi:hypothetical protein